MEETEFDRTAIQLDFEANQAVDQVVILHNPKAGASVKSNLIVRLEAELEKSGFEAKLFSDVDAAVEATNLALSNRRLRTVVAAGGDGTASMVANRFGPETPITIFPLGTENLLAKYLGITNDPRKAAQIIREGIMVRLDAGQANGHLFLVMASCGFDAEVVRQMHENRKGNITHFAYAKPIWTSIRNYKYPMLRIRCFGTKLKNSTFKRKRRRNSKPGTSRPKKIKAKWAFVFNMPRYAMGLPIADAADGMDGKLDICTFRNGNLINGLIYLLGVLTRQHRSFKDTSMIQATRIVIDSDQQVPYQLDGDPGGFLPLEINVLPKRLAVLVPKLWTTSRNLSITTTKSLQVS